MNIQELFDSRGVWYSTRQHSQGNIGINCPFCADSIDPDPSNHMGVSITTGAFHCWRCKEKGGKPHYLLWKLLGMSHGDVDDVLGIISPQKQITPRELTSLGEDARNDWNSFLDLAHPMASGCRKYLQARGITDKTMSLFKLKAGGVAGKWAHRIVFPVRAPDGASVTTWTARAIGNATPKYLALGREQGANIKAQLFNAEKVSKPGRTLVVCEGPMDAIVLQQLAPYSTVTCVFGLKASEKQIALIRGSGYSQVVFLFDSTAFQAADDCARRAGCEVLNYERLFRRHGDPGDLTEADKPALESVGIV